MLSLEAHAKMMREGSAASAQFIKDTLAYLRDLGLVYIEEEESEQEA